MPEDPQPEPPTDRDSPVGEPVVRGDRSLVGDRAGEAVAFDPEDTDSVATAAETVWAFANSEAGAAACAALVRAEGSYTAAAERAGGEATVAFIRKWARVHDLPYAVRTHVATGAIAPSAAKHIARVGGDARLALAWAAVDADLTVREVRSVASDVADGADVEAALRAAGVTPGELTVELPTDVYLDLRRRAARSEQSVDDVVAGALAAYLE